jgi:hypothetical protein
MLLRMPLENRILRHHPYRPLKSWPRPSRWLSHRLQLDEGLKRHADAPGFSDRSPGADRQGSPLPNRGSKRAVRPAFAHLISRASARSFAWLASRGSLSGKVSEGWWALQDSNL